MSQSMIAYYNETAFTENAVNVIIKNNKIYKYYYSQRAFNNKYEIDELIYDLTLVKGFVLNKTDKMKTEFIDFKTGLIRYIFWPNNVVERIVEEQIGDATADNSLIEF